MVQPSGIVTPEAVVLDFRTATVASRLLAASIDLAAQFGALVAVGTLLAAVAGEGGLGWVGVVVIVVVTFLVLFGYPVTMETLWRGRTLGKAAMGLRVVTVEGGPVRFRHAAIRAALTLVDHYLPPLGVTAVLAILLTRRDQRLGDLVAGTLVVRERLAALPPTAVTFPPPPGYEAYTASLDAAALDEEQYRVLRSFLLRRHGMTPEARARLAATIGNGTARVLRHTPPPMVGPELFLACAAAAYQRRSQPVLGSPRGAEDTVATPERRGEDPLAPRRGDFAPPA